MSGKINMCTAVFYPDPEAYGTKDVKVEYGCVKGGLSVSACKWYMPLRCVNGETCVGECNHFDNGCTCRKARAYALRRAKKLMTASRNLRSSTV